MNLEQFGEQLREKFPREAGNAPAEVLAVSFLRQYPQFAYLVGSSTQQIQDLTRQSPGLLGILRAEAVAQGWGFRRQAAEAIQNINLQLQASLRGLDVPTFMAMRLDESSADQQVKVIEAQAQSQVKVIEAQTEQDIRYAREQADIEVRKQREIIEAKLRFAREHHELKLALDGAVPKGEAEDAGQPGEVRRRAVPEGDGQEVGQLR